MKLMKTKKSKIILLIIIIILLCPFNLSYSKTNDTFQYSSILFSYERLLLGTKEPHPVNENIAVVNYSIETKVKILFLTVYDHYKNYEAWIPAS